MGTWTNNRLVQDGKQIHAIQLLRMENFMVEVLVTTAMLSILLYLQLRLCRAKDSSIPELL